MPTKFYRKEIPEQPVYVHGTPLKFEVLETSDGALIEELDNCIKFSRGGIISIGKEEFDEEIKKNPRGILSESGFKQKQQRLELLAPHISPSLAADAASAARLSGAFAHPQEREHRPHNQPGLPSMVNGPTPVRGGMPDPIEVPTVKEFKPTTAKLSEVTKISQTTNGA